MKNYQQSKTAVALLAQQNGEINALREELDSLSTLRWDLEERNGYLASKVFFDEEDINKLSQQLATKDLECQKAIHSVKNAEDNLSYVRANMKFQEETLSIAVAELSTLRASKANVEYNARKLIDLTNQNDHLKTIISLLIRGMNEIKSTSIFKIIYGRKNIAIDVLYLVKTYNDEIHKKNPTWNNCIGKM